MQPPEHLDASLRVVNVDRARVHGQISEAAAQCAVSGLLAT